jgi:iron complex outermembrane receptor protein
LSGGYSNGRFHSLAVLDYFDRGFLLGSDRDRWRNQDYRRFGSVDRRTTISNPGNITSTTLDNLPGLPSRFAAVPTGSTGVGLTPADFLATAGQENKVSLARYSTIVPETDRRSVAVFADFDITSNLNAFGDLLYADRRSNFSQEPSVTVDDAIVPAKNPFNPFGVDVSVDYLPTGPGPNQSHVESNLYRVTAGLRGAFGMWDWELSALRSDEDTKIWVENQLDPARVYAAVSALDRAQALNVFQDGPGGSPALLASLLVDPAESTSKTSSKGTQGAAVIRGQLGTLPAGAVEMVIGGEWIESDILFDDFTFVKHGRTASAAFAELRMPLVSPAMQIPGVKGLSLTLAARQDHYSDFGDTFNPQYGLVWRPVSDLMVRASYGTSFRAPSLFELFAPRQEFSGVQILDPARNSELASVRFITGGNPDLNPTEADSFTAGLVFTPGALKGLQLSSTYWRVRMENGVKILPFYVILANEERFADRVVRGPADTVSGLPGVLQTLDISRVNFGSIETSGVDSGAAYSFDTKVGRFSPSLSATWVADYKVVELPGTPAVDTVGVASLNGTILRWRATATLGWAIRGVGLSATGRYSPGYEDATTSTGPTGRHLSSQVLVDMQGSLDFDEFFSNRSAWLPGLKLTAGVSNLFDKEPNFSEITDVRGFDPAQGDLMQRFAYLKLSATF